MKTLDDLAALAVELCTPPGIIRVDQHWQPASADIARARLRHVVERDRAATCSPRSKFWPPNWGRWVFHGSAPDGRRHRAIYRWVWPR